MMPRMGHMLCAMTPSALGPPGQWTIGARAARALVSELARRPGPKTALLADARPGSAVLNAAIGALAPEDTLAVTAPDPAGMRDHLAGLGSWVLDRVRVVEAAPGPVDVVVRAEQVRGGAEDARASLTELLKLLTPGGVVCVATVAVPAGGGAPAELERQAVLYGADSDLVVLNPPPLRIHRFRSGPTDPSVLNRLAPVARPSSVPLTRDMHIDSSGVVVAGAALAVAVLAKVARPRGRGWLLPAAAALPVAAFFRDPHREPPEDPSQVVAAGDGRVIGIEHTRDDRFSPDGETAEYVRVAAFLSVLDVHVNRAPVAGTVVDHFLEDGGYAPAMRVEAEHNVSGYTVLDTPRGRVAVAQRTGLLARRLVHRTPVGSPLARGERFGLIRFGSRVDVYLPAGATEPLVTAGDRLLGGVTPIARWR